MAANQIAKYLVTAMGIADVQDNVPRADSCACNQSVGRTSADVLVPEGVSTSSRFSDCVQIRPNGINELCKLNEKIRQAGSRIDAKILASQMGP